MPRSTEPTSAADAFGRLIGLWRDQAMKLAQAKADYVRAYAQALATAEGKTAEVREAAAKAKCEAERMVLDLATIDERAALFSVHFALRQAGRPVGEDCGEEAA